MNGSEQSAPGIRISRFPNGRILIVGDDPAFAMPAAEILRQAGLEVSLAVTAAEAAGALASFSPDLVLLGVKLPDGDGFDLCRRIRTSSLNYHIPVILVTGPDDAASIEKAYE